MRRKPLQQTHTASKRPKYPRRCTNRATGARATAKPRPRSKRLAFLANIWPKSRNPRHPDEFLAIAPPKCEDGVRRGSTPDMKDEGKPSQPAEPTLDEARLRQQAIGVKLRHMFDEIVNEPVPQDFLDILRRADDKGDADGKG